MALNIETDEEWAAVQRLLKEMRSGAVSSGADSREQAVVFWRRKLCAVKNKNLATKIFEELVRRGAGIGNVSIGIIEKVLDEQIKQMSEKQKQSGQTEPEKSSGLVGVEPLVITRLEADKAKLILKQTPTWEKLSKLIS